MEDAGDEVDVGGGACCGVVLEGAGGSEGSSLGTSLGATAWMVALGEVDTTAAGACWAV